MFSGEFSLTVTMPWYPGQTGYGVATSVIVLRTSSNQPLYRAYDNEPTRKLVDKFARLTETLLQRRRRISREQKRLAASRLRRFGLPRLPEAMFDKPTFVRRACGSRWRVMTP